MLRPTKYSPIEKALAFQKAGRLDKAAEIYQRILATDPRHPDALHLLGVILHSRGQLEQALELIRESLLVRPHHSAALNNLANVLKDQGRWEDALEFYDAAIAQAPKGDHLHSNRGIVLKNLGRCEEAVEAFDCAIALHPRSAVTHLNRGSALSALGRIEEAIAAYRSALELQPDSSETYSNLGVAWRERGELALAEECLRKAVQLNPKSDVAHQNLGATLNDLGRPGDAVPVLLRALELNPKSFRAANNLGNALKALGRFDQAVVCFRKAISLAPESHLGWNNLGATLNQLGKAVEALEAFDRALEAAPLNHHAFSNRLFTLNYLPGIGRAELFQEHQRFDEQFGQRYTAFQAPHANAPEPERRLRVGYVSADLREHPVAAFIEPLLATHSKRDFEVFCYANQTRHDSTTARLRAHADHWREVAGLQDDELAALIRRDAIDILVDLSGHTAGNRLLAFARKPAPVQVTMIGYMQTTGLRAIDYRITDASLDPVGVSEQFSSEELIRLPAGAATFQPPANCPPPNELPALTNGRVTFAAFNNLAKVTPEVLAAWAEILQRVPDSRLLAVGRTGNSVKETLIQHGVAGERIEMVERLPLREFLALHHRADVLLDTFPCNGGSTTLLAAWMGVPFVTVCCDNSTGRAGEGLLRGLGLPELVATSVDEYVGKAASVAGNLRQLSEWRGVLRARLAPMLSESSEYTLQLEHAFRGMWTKWCAAQAAARSPEQLQAA